MRRHPEIGRRIVSSIPDLGGTTVDCIVHHHEWWDGNGYPHRLAGPAIPLGARIVSVVDVWDALSTSRPYKRAYPQETVRLLLRKGAGAQFDPELLELFLRILDEEGDEMVALLGESARPAAEVGA
jgi:HD-GYP domain-containing protein (c-di-GMP phosphodiesterase class II)